MSQTVASAQVASQDDLGPLVWVLDELRKSLDGASKALRRFVRDAEIARTEGLTDLDTSHLRIARQQLHQAVGALEMVGQSSVAKLVRAMESLVQRYVQRPELCSDDAASAMERASFAVVEYLETLLKGKTSSAVALFPQWQALLEYAGESQRIHPADLWLSQWTWRDVGLDDSVTATEYAPSTRQSMEQALLRYVRYSDLKAAHKLSDLAQGLSRQAGASTDVRAFWALAAAFFEALAQQLLPVDVYVKRIASRVLQQYVSLATKNTPPSERVGHELLFFCSQALPSLDGATPVLTKVRDAYGLATTRPVEYAKEQFGRFDPTVLATARKRITTAAETWSALAGGDVQRLKQAADQFASVAESIAKLHAENQPLAQALVDVVQATVQSGAAPKPSVAMEVATAVLYLEAAYDEMDPSDEQLAVRGQRLAQRLDHVRAGGAPQPLEAWMEDLYRRVSDRQTMGSVVDELRHTLTEVEKSLDAYFRNPADTSVLAQAPNQIAQMRGVFSVLGMDQPATAALRMRSTVEDWILAAGKPKPHQSQEFEKVGSSLGAMGFLIDMLSYQRALAKTMFVFDEEQGVLRPTMGRRQDENAPSGADDDGLAEDLAQLQALMQTDSLSDEVATSAPNVTQAPASVVLTPDEDDDDLLGIFLEEAREVIHNGQEALGALKADNTNLADQTTLRRAFHTLKGSSRMVGLTEFGEAAWAFEQLLNTSLAEHKPATEEMQLIAGHAMAAFGQWVRDIESQQASTWSAQPFRITADALRLEGRLAPLQVPTHARDSVLAALHPSLSDGHVAVETQHPAQEEGQQAESLAHADFAATQSAAIEEAPPSVEMVDFADTAPGVAEDDSKLPAINELPHLIDIPQDITEPNLAQDAPIAIEPAVTESVISLDFPAVDVTQTSNQLESTSAPQAEVVAEDIDFALELDFPAEAVAPPSLPVVLEVNPPPKPEDEIKVVGHLRISPALFNVFLGEADEWSQKLQESVQQWRADLALGVPEAAIACAHSLLGSSATVGFTALSELARALESALEHLQRHLQSQSAHADLALAAALDIRRLLHQFAAGVLKEADEDVLVRLHALAAQDFSEDVRAVEIDEPLVATSDAVSEPEFGLEAIELPEVLIALDDATSPPVGAPVEASSTAANFVAAPLVVLSAQDDDLDAVDNLDPDLLEIFREEADELMPALGTALRLWVDTPTLLDQRAQVLRLLHTLKGSARLAGAMRVGEMAHRMETAIESLGSDGLQTVQIEPLLTRFDTIQTAVQGLEANPELSPEWESSALDAAEITQDTQIAAVPEAFVLEARAAEDGIDSGAAEAVKPERVVKPAVVMPKIAVRTPVQSAVAKATGQQTVRVRSQLIDQLLNQAGEVLIARSRMDEHVGQMRSTLSDLTGNLDRLRQQLRDVEVQAESQMQSRLAQAKDSAQGFDPLEFDRFTRVQELTRMMAESVNDVATVQRNLQQSIDGAEDDLIAQARQARELQRDLLRTRMVEFDSIADRLYGVVRQASKDAGKQVRLEIEGANIEVDRAILERMAPAFEHLLRNAIAHGVESSDARQKAGKALVGQIQLGVEQESNEVSVVFSDDGAGLNLQRIREKAQAAGLVSADAVLTDADVAELIFHPGLSTADQVTELAGRGIGMDVVRAEVQAVGGRIETHTETGKGTQFKLVLPLTTAVTQVVLLRMGNFTMGVPANNMEIVLRVSPDGLANAYRSNQFEYGMQAMPFFWAGALLQVSRQSEEPVGKTTPVVIMRSAGQHVALHVDEVLGNREVVVKNLGAQLSRLPGLAGMSVLPSGAVVLIYNPVALAAVYGEQVLAQASAEPLVTDAPQVASPVATGSAHDSTPLVLVVDDSITVRRVTQRLLRREGYRVALANDGLQALERLQEEVPAVVLSDIEMPRMDGFDLARNIRADDKLKHLPIIMITSRIAEKHREHAKAIGVDHYLGKPYSEEQLLALVAGYCKQPEATTS
ncbi:Hpt domain-containing protein [Curvibacter sp. CHRR-16]|uniref:hybrid sensor histidine kinase/response regulator n=1 Tax=Curvibacter sp. CHRR-16 TaxID=2835872 RepID=UPI002023A21B|nr:Hpt domain-containing protein [Curvibacter sp. CHRR-16]